MTFVFIIKSCSKISVYSICNLCHFLTILIKMIWDINVNLLRIDSMRPMNVNY